jgi:hypothetical protein
MSFATPRTSTRGLIPEDYSRGGSFHQRHADDLLISLATPTRLQIFVLLGKSGFLFAKTKEGRERKQTKASEVGKGVGKVGAVSWRQQQRGRQRKGEGQADREAFPAQGLPATILSLRSRPAVPLLFTTFVSAIAQQNDTQLRPEDIEALLRTCPVAELRSFVKARRLKMPTNSRRTSHPSL